MKAPPKSPNSKVEVMHVITLEQPADTSTATRYPTSTSTRSEQSKLLGLELLRFISAFAVLVFHYQHFVFRGVSQPATFVRSDQPLYSVLSLFYVHGFEGVRVFWCISGFIFFWRYRDLIGDGQIGGRKFLILRFSRLYPLHFVTLLLVAILQVVYLRINGSFFVYSANDFPHFVLQLFMASNWGISEGDSFNGPIWSISLEVLVYALFYVLLAFVSKSCLINIGVLLMCGLARILGLHHLIFDCLAFFYSGGPLGDSVSIHEKSEAASLVDSIGARHLSGSYFGHLDILFVCAPALFLFLFPRVYTASAFLSVLGFQVATSRTVVGRGSRQHDLLELPIAFSVTVGSCNFV